jgi:hypothetical protein
MYSRGRAREEVERSGGYRGGGGGFTILDRWVGGLLLLIEFE